jgi:hypothetical protein
MLLISSISKFFESISISWVLSSNFRWSLCSCLFWQICFFCYLQRTLDFIVFFFQEESILGNETTFSWTFANQEPPNIPSLFILSYIFGFLLKIKKVWEDHNFPRHLECKISMGYANNGIRWEGALLICPKIEGKEKLTPKLDNLWKHNGRRKAFVAIKGICNLLGSFTWTNILSMPKMNIYIQLFGRIL